VQFLQARPDAPAGPLVSAGASAYFALGCLVVLLGKNGQAALGTKPLQECPQPGDSVIDMLNASRSHALMIGLARKELSESTVAIV